MAKGYVIYNPLAGNGTAAADAELLSAVLDEELEFYDMTRITNYGAFLSGLEREDYLVIVGGDGTLNRFANDTAGLTIAQQILYFPAGTGNDFAKEIGADGGPVPITQYLRDLPTVQIGEKTCRFVNGIGFGLDGYCCQVGDERKKQAGKKVNYTAIAVEGLLYGFRPVNAVVTVDGTRHAYKRVWIAPTMHGKCYGGGMYPTPDQERGSGKLSVMLFHGAGKLRTLCVFPSIFRGTHIRHTDMVAVHTGREITVEFDRPAPLQIDGECIRNVTRYTARAAAAQQPASRQHCANF